MNSEHEQKWFAKFVFMFANSKFTKMFANSKFAKLFAKWTLDQNGEHEHVR